jgi:hypothetical protein
LGKAWEHEGGGVYQGSVKEFVGTEENKPLYEESPKYQEGTFHVFISL